MDHPPTREEGGIAPEGRDDPDEVLRAKYLDYCSARLSEIFLSIEDERVYDLVEDTAARARLDLARMGFGEMVRLVTHRLRHSVPFPDFESWAREYREAPERYDPYLLGLWEEELDAGALPREGAE